jgi:hypothetical protein
MGVHLYRERREYRRFNFSTYEQRQWDRYRLPEYVHKCSWCDGAGQYRQTYTVGCGGGSYRTMGSCDNCDGIGLVYFDGGPVPPSVIDQILNTCEIGAVHA